jgi:hypothetical protein
LITGFFEPEFFMEDHRKVSRIMKYVGFSAMAVGVALPFLMSVRWITPTLFLVFFSHTLSVAGVLCGMLGVTGYADDIARPR